MKNPEAIEWMRLAEAIVDGLNTLKAVPFLCNALHGDDATGYWGWRYIPHPDLAQKMKARLRDREGWGDRSVPEAWNEFNGETIKEQAEWRILACIWLAHEAEDEC